ncbi:MAG: zinc dependent phospholipase C family protein, partial [Desulfosalsimonadaceae bacterium]|nr:zinc dependent phospholipase C family protein [Desulfosalsimonadaceae bacterium]
MKNYMKLLGAAVMLMLVAYPAGVLAWDSNASATQMDTHKMIAEQGVLILQNDLSGNAAPEVINNLQILHDNLYDLKRGAVWPDFNTNEYDLYQDHFYDPDTGKNFTNGVIPDTAESQTRLHVAVAVHKWKNGDYSGAAFELGTAMHFFADINEPHHASNQTGGEGTAHTEFEQWVELGFETYAVNGSGHSTDSSYYTDTVNNFTYITDFITSQANICGRAAKALAPYAQMTSTWDDWEYVAPESLKIAQQSAALVYFRFLNEVALEQLSAVTGPIGKFHVEFKVSDVTNAGTDDTVYFGMKLKNGRTMEFKCDVPGDDFYRNLRWAYEFNITDATFKAADVTKVWIRKKDFTVLGDDLRLDYMNVYMKGKNVLTKPINAWLGT